MRGLIVYTFLVLSVCSLSFAAGLTDTDFHIRPASPPEFGATHKTTDPTFGTTILRVTGPVGSNALYESAETQNLGPIQHFHNPWNYDGSMFLVWANRLSEGGTGAGVDLYSLDPSTFTASRIRRISAGAISAFNYNRGIKWATSASLAAVDRKWIAYAVDTSVTPNAIKRWNLDTVSTHDGLAANSSESLHTDSEGIDQLTVSTDDDRFAYYTSNKKVKVWVRSTNTTYTADLSSWYSFDESQMTPDGQYVFAKGHINQGDDYTARFDYTMTNQVNYSSYSGTTPDDFAGKHSGYGTWWVNETGQHGDGYRLAYRQPSAGKGTPSYIWQSNQSGIATHPSHSTTDYVFAGVFRPYSYNSSYKYLDEIVMIKTDGTQVRRLAHAWSNFFSNSYDEIPCYGSPDNQFVMFYTNWNGSTSGARHDVFIVQAGSGKRYANARSVTQD